MSTTTVLIPATAWREFDITLEMVEGRQARCAQCKKTMPTLEAIQTGQAFFEWRGPGYKGCDHCGYYECTHALDQPDGVNPVTGRPADQVDHHFANDVGREFDGFYCGCRGWD